MKKILLVTFSVILVVAGGCTTVFGSNKPLSEDKETRPHRTYVIGDVHGAYKALVQAVERSPFNPETDRLVSLGDIADGWSQVPECVEFLLSIPQLLAIRGNHDWWAYEWIAHGVAQRSWRMQGGQSTLDAYERFFAENPDRKEAHVEFFKNQYPYYSDGSGRLFVHGGFTSHRGAGHEPYQSNYFWDRSLWEAAMALGTDPVDIDDERYPKRFKHHQEIFIGHTATMMFGQDTPMNRANVWNLDTGAGFNGKVSIMDADSKEFWQSDCVLDLYPDEPGRGRFKVKMKK